MKKKSSLKHTGAFWAFCAPCCILFGVFFLVPLVLSIAFSFTNYDGWKTIDFVGLTNYITLFKDSKFYLSLGRTLLYTVCTLPFRVIIPLLVAVLLCSKRVAAKSLTRTMVYIPVLMSALVVGITINWMFSQEYGLVNFIITFAGRHRAGMVAEPASCHLCHRVRIGLGVHRLQHDPLHRRYQQHFQ